MNTGQIISGAGHAGLIGWALLAGVFTSEPLPFEVTEVTAISGEEYAALVAQSNANANALNMTAPEAPDVESAPELGSEADAAPHLSQPDVAEAAPPDKTPELTEVTPPADAEVSDEAPELTPPSEDVTVLLPELSERPQPRPVERVAPEAVAPPEPDMQVDEVAQPEVAPDEAATTPREETDATAPEEATTEIVTEAEDAAPSRSLRPKTRPSRPEPVETAQPSEDATPTDSADTDNSAVNDALAEALGGGQTGTAEPSGPPLTRGEKDALRVAVKQCWNVGSLSSDALNVTVVVSVRVGEDGKPTSVSQLSALGGSGSAVNQAYEAARRAVLRCGAKGFDLPRDKYDHWRDIEMTFNPEKMRIK